MLAVEFDFKLILNLYSVSTKKNKANYFLAQHHQITIKCNNFCHSNLRDNCEFAYDYVFHLTCVTPIPGKTFHTSYFLTIKKTVKPKIQKFSALI